MRPRLGDRGERYYAAVNKEVAEGLQCGHGWATVENQAAGRAAPGARHASMRPRLGDRGEQQVNKMKKLAETTLQCGHGWATVENFLRTGFSTRVSKASM